MTLLLLAACSASKPDTLDTPDADRAVDTDGDTGETAEDTGETDGPDDSAAESGDPDDTAAPYAVPTADAPFVVTGCGFQDGGPTLVPVPDSDGDGLEEVLVVVAAEVEVWGTWLVPSTAATAPYWDQPLRWDTAGDVRVLPDLDGDGLAELYAVEGDTVTRLLPDGTVTAWTGVPTRFAPWHDVDGDGASELLVGAPALSADGVTTGYVAVVSASDPDPATWVTLATVSGEGLGAAFGIGTLDQDGDGHPDPVVTDAANGYLLASAALDAGGALADATLATYAGVAGRTPVAVGDADGGGLEDVVFTDGRPYGGSVLLFSGESPDAPVEWGGPGTYGDVGEMVVGPDGAGGQALWVNYGAVQTYDIGDLLGGVNTRLRSGWGSRIASAFGVSSESVWIAQATTGSGWDTRVIGAKLDLAVDDAVLAEVEGGGPGYGGEADAAGLDDIDGDGAPDWWQLAEGTFFHHPLVPGATVTVCDAASWPAVGWSAADPGSDLDGDGVPEVAWYAEPSSTGLWSAATGSVAEYEFDGALRQLGCDLTGDGVRELQFVTFGSNFLVDGATWLGVGIDRSVLAVIKREAACVGDLDGDGVPELADAWLDVVVYDGASLVAGAPAALATFEGPGVGGVQRVGDVDGDGLGDLVFGVWGDRVGTCLVPGADLLVAGTRPVGDVACELPATPIPADVDGDGVNELLYRGADTLEATWPATGASATVWTADDDARDEPLFDVIVDAFGPGRAAIVLGPDPIVVYALRE